MLAEKLREVNTLSPLDAAIFYARQGWRVLPLHTISDGHCTCLNPTCGRSSGKHPLTPDGVKSATTNEETIREWWSKYPWANVGIATGEVRIAGEHTNLVVVDWDDADAYHDYIDACGPLAYSIITRTQSRGFHIYALSDDIARTFNHDAGEVRSNGAYVVASPSIGLEGQYQWEEGGQLVRATVDEFPTRRGSAVTREVIQLNTAEPVNLEKLPLSQATLARIFHRTPEQDQSRVDFIVTCELVRQGLTDNQILHVFQTYPIGTEGKFARKGHLGRDYLQLTIGQARAEVNYSLEKLTTPEMETMDTVTEQPTTVFSVTPPQNMDKGDAAYLTTRSADDVGNAECVLHLFPDIIAYVEELGWLIYNGQFWQTDNARPRVDGFIIETLRARRMMAVQTGQEHIAKATTLSDARVNACRNRLQSMVGMDLTISDFDANIYHLNCQNGVVDLRTGEIIPHSPNLYFTYVLPVPYIPNLQAKLWTDFLRTTLQNEATGAVGEKLDELIEYLQLSVGYTLTGDTREEIFYYIYGPTRSGKGTFTQTLLSLMGRPLAKSVDFATFTSRKESDPNNFDLAPLKPTRFVTASESSQYDWLDDSKVKIITGGDEVRCAFKHKTHFEYKPQFTVWMTSNNYLKGNPDDGALWGRARVIEFPNTFYGKEDKTLKSRMQSDENLVEVLSWAVAGAVKWYALPKSSLPTPVVVRETTKRHQAEIDVTQQFLDACVEVTGADTDFASSAEIYRTYEAWCKAEGHTCKTQRGLTFSLKSKGITTGVDGTDKDGHRGRGSTGIRIRWHGRGHVILG